MLLLISTFISESGLLDYKMCAAFPLIVNGSHTPTSHVGRWPFPHILDNTLDIQILFFIA